MKTRDFDRMFFEALPGLRRHLHSKGCDRELVHDLEQEVFVRATIRRGLFDPSRGSFEAWLHRMAVNLLRTYIRRKRVDERSLERRAALQRASERVEEGAMTVEAADEASRASAAFNTLSEGERRLLSAVVIEGKRPSDLAAEFPHLRANTIAQRASRARAHLRSAFLQNPGKNRRASE